MSSSPKKSDYEAGPEELAAASVAQHSWNDFKTKYQPLLLEMRDRSVKAEVGDTVRGRANADAMQALTDPANLNVRQVGNTDVESSVGLGLLGQLGEANETVAQADADQSLGVLSAARGQAATAQAGLSQAARLESSERLNEARNKASSAQAKFNAAVQVGSALAGSGLRNINGGGSFFTPNAGTMDVAAKPESLRERFEIGLGRL